NTPRSGLIRPQAKGPPSHGLLFAAAGGAVLMLLIVLLVRMTGCRGDPKSSPPTDDVSSPPAKEGPKDKELVNSLGMKLARIPAGKFMMGSSDKEEQRGGDEGPQFEVELTQPFYMGCHEVTVGQFRAFAETTGYVTDAEESRTGAWNVLAQKQDAS